MIIIKFIKFIGLLSLFCFTFLYTEKIIDISIEQDEIMIKLQEQSTIKNIQPINAVIENNTIIPGNVGKYIDIEESYKKMKKIGIFKESLIIYKDIYPEVSIYNNYNKYIINGNIKNKSIALIYIINPNTLDDILNIIQNKNIKINFFIDSNYLNNNINIINKLINYEIYNYGNKGIYTKENLIFTNNIINTKANNNSTYCLFLKEDDTSINNCANSKMLSITPSINGNYNKIKDNLKNGSIILINNTKELSNIIDYIKSKGYSIETLSNIIKE